MFELFFNVTLSQETFVTMLFAAFNYPEILTVFN